VALAAPSGPPHMSKGWGGALTKNGSSYGPAPNTFRYWGKGPYCCSREGGWQIMQNIVAHKLPITSPHKTPNKSKLFIGVSETRGDRKMKRGDVIKIELNDAKQTDDAVEGWPI